MPGLVWRRESRWDSSAGNTRRSSRLTRSRSCDRPADRLPRIAHELGIGASSLGHWLKQDEAGRKSRDPERFATESAESAENRALRRRVAELEVEREILKRATAFWVKESRA